MRLLRYIFLFLLTGFFLLTSADISLAGKFKSRMQQRLNAPSNIQYEPYYVESDNRRDREQNKRLAPQGAAEAPATLRERGLHDGEARDGFQQAAYQQFVYADEVKALSTPYAIYNVNYTSELEENVVTVKGEITFEVFENGRIRIPLVSSTVGLIDVTVNKSGSFVVNYGGKYHLVMSKKGRYTLNIEYLIKATREREHGPGSFAVDVMSAPISQFEFSMPEKGVQIFIEPAIKVEQDDEIDKTVAWAVMPNTNAISVRWTKALPKDEIEKVELEPKVYVETSTHSSIGGGVIRNSSFLNYSILQSEVSSFRVALSDEVSVLNVTGADIRDWKITTREGVQYLDVFLNFGRKGNYNLNITYEKNIAEGSGISQMPWVRAVGVERETGYYGVAASTNVELAIKSSKKATRIDSKQLPSNIWHSSSNPILLAFKYLNPPFNVEIEVTKHTELPVLVAAIDTASHVTLHTDEGKILTKVTYQVRNNVKQFLRFKLPEDAVIWSSFVAGAPVKPAKDNKGNILVPLQKSQLQGQNLTRFPVEIVYLDKGAELNLAGKLNLHLPSTDIPINQFYWSVYLPYDFTYFNFDGDVRPVDKQVYGGFFKRALQSRVRDAADDIGDQFSPGNTNVARYSSRGQQQLAVKTVAKGILPIRINVPQQGQFFQFSKLLVVEGESPQLSVQYTGILDKIRKPIKFIILLGIAALITIGVLRFLKKRKKS